MLPLLMDGDMGYRVQTLDNKTASVEKNGSNFKRRRRRNEKSGSCVSNVANSKFESLKI